MTSKSSQLILLKPKLPQDKYIRALYGLLKREQFKSITGEDPDLNVKIVFLYAKICAVYRYDSERPSREDVLTHWNHLETAKHYLKRLSPMQFERTFPIKKEYDGERFQCKDYYYTKKALEEYDPDMPIGDRIEDFLWEYHNDTIREVVVGIMSTASDIRRLNGQPSLAEEWAAAHDVGMIYAPPTKPKSRAKLRII